MYLKCELPDGYFRIFDDISDLVIPKERVMINFPPPPNEVSGDECTHGISVHDAIDNLSAGGKYAIAHLIGIHNDEVRTNPDIDFVCNSRQASRHEENDNSKPPMWQRFPHHQMLVFKNKKDITTVFVTQYPVYVCNEEGKTIEKIK